MKVTFLPSGERIDAFSGESVLDCARRAGVLIEAPCDGRGRCGRCAVRVSSGELSPAGADEAALLRFAPEGTRLACRALVGADDVVVESLYHSGTGALHLQDAQPKRVEETGALRPLGLAVDLGTTTVAVSVLDLESGVVLATASAANRQASWGADVLSRVNASLEDPVVLRVAAEQSILDALQPLLDSGSIDTRQITKAVIAGNSVMAGLLAENSLEGLLVPPFEGGDGEVALAPNSLLAQTLSPHTVVTVLAPLEGFVGGDTVAAVVATRLVDTLHTALLVDLGTNAEIALWAGGTLYYASAAAGPAFEGGGISCGGPATEGAIVRFSEIAVPGDKADSDRYSNLVPVVIGDVDPLWLTGSGLISLLTRLRDREVVDSTGRISERPYGGVSLQRDGSGVLTIGIPGTGEALHLSQLDIRAIQLAKAAVSAGVTTVLAQAGISAQDIDRVYVAGAFGSAIDPADLLALGVLPVRDASIVESVGNAALSGARSLLLAQEFAADADGGNLIGARPLDRVPRVHVPLSGNRAFENAFMSAFDLDPADLIGK